MGVDIETLNGFERYVGTTLDVGAVLKKPQLHSSYFNAQLTIWVTVLLKDDPMITSRPIEVVIAAMKLLAIIPVSRGVKHAEHVSIQQSPDEVFRAFAARVRGKAETCAFSINAKFTCGVDNVINLCSK